jgi:TonB-linked SusC/RagA family outer membrane protein
MFMHIWNYYKTANILKSMKRGFLVFMVLCGFLAGLSAQEKLITGMNTVTEETLSLPLEEVTGAAYGVQTQGGGTGSVGVVKSAEIRDISETSIEKMLAGKVAGVQVTSSSGQPGAASEIRIRGISSVNAGAEPLYVIDGIPVMSGNQSYFTNTGNALASLNPNDVESVTILKDAAASGIYGSRAANGVILITTKSGKPGVGKINFRASYGVEQLANDNGYRPMTAEEYLTYQRLAVTNAGGNPDDPARADCYFPLSLLDGPATDWQKELTRAGSIYSAGISAEGGTDKTANFFSLHYDDHQGIVYGSDFKRYTLRSNVDHKLSNRIKLGTRINGAYTRANDVAMQSLYHTNPLFTMIMIKPFTPLYNDDGTYNLNIPENNYTNPRAAADYNRQWEKQYRVNGNGYLEYNIIEGFTARTTNGIELTDGEGMRLWAPQATFGEERGTLQVSRTRYLMLTTSNTLNYSNEFDKHSVSVVAGQEASKYDYNGYYIYSPGVHPDMPFPSSATAADDDADYYESDYTLLSFFGVANYNFDRKYYFQASLRSDASSRFSEEKRWGTFWSLGASWNIHNEAFMENVSLVDMLRLRGSYGTSGNFNIGNYGQYGLYRPAEYNAGPVIVPVEPVNPVLGWENSSEYNAGFDFALFERIAGSFDVYSRKTTNMILYYPLSSTPGSSSIGSTTGSVRNTGFEFLLDGKIITGDDFNWSAGFNISHNKSEILDLGNNDQFVLTLNKCLAHKVGERLYSFYLYDYAGVNPANGEAMWYNEEGELTHSYAEARRIIAGSPEPKLTGGFNTAVSYKGLTLDINFEFKYGNLICLTENRYANSDGFSWPNNYANTQLDYWTTPGQIARNPKPVANNISASSSSLSTRWLYDGSYLRVKHLTLSYTLPGAVTSKMKMQNLRVYASAVNLYTFHKVDFWDPERGVEGCGVGIYPQTKRITGGIELSF